MSDRPGKSGQSGESGEGGESEQSDRREISRVNASRAQRADDDPDDRTTDIGATATTEWLVDGYNVLHAILLGGEDRSEWWRDAARKRLVDRARRLPGALGQVWLVFDGNRPAADAEPDASGLRIVFTPSADDWIHQRARRAIGPPPIVVTADRRLARRCRRRGARIVVPADFVAACAVESRDDVDPPGADADRHGESPGDAVSGEATSGAGSKTGP